MEMSNFNQEKENNSLKKWVIILSILSVILLATTIYFAFFGTTQINTEYVKSEDARNQLQSELDNLIVEHEKIKVEYGELTAQLSEKDSVIMANAEEIKKLINSQADYNKIKRQLSRLQNIAKEYVAEMDRLYQENKALKEENTQVKETLVKTQEKVATVEEHNKELNDKISSEAYLRAYNVTSYAVYNKNRTGEEIRTDKASKARRFKVSFILGENSLIKPGPVNLYCRIATPETGKVLSPGSSDTYAFEFEGKKMQFSARKTINYVNTEASVSMEWNILQDDKAIKGKYLVEIYTENHLLGQTYFVLE
jgi:hypothetical protein